MLEQLLPIAYMFKPMLLFYNPALFLKQHFKTHLFYQLAITQLHVPVDEGHFLVGLTFSKIQDIQHRTFYKINVLAITGNGECAGGFFKSPQVPARQS